MEFSDRIVALKKGRVVFDGAPSPVGRGRHRRHIRHERGSRSRKRLRRTKPFGRSASYRALERARRIQKGSEERRRRIPPRRRWRHDRACSAVGRLPFASARQARGAARRRTTRRSFCAPHGGRRRPWRSCSWRWARCRAPMSASISCRQSSTSRAGSFGWPTQFVPSLTSLQQAGHHPSRLWVRRFSPRSPPVARRRFWPISVAVLGSRIGGGGWAVSPHRAGHRVAVPQHPGGGLGVHLAVLVQAERVHRVLRAVPHQLRVPDALFSGKHRRDERRVR